MFERFTERARQVVVLAQDEARDLRNDYIDTEHLLLGLIREDEGIAARALRSLGIDLDTARSRVPRGEGERRSTGQIPFRADAKHALEDSADEATGMGHPSIGTEHLLLGLVRGESNAAARILREVGVTPSNVRARVLAMLSGEYRE